LIARLPEVLQGKSVKQLATEVGYTERSRRMYTANIRKQLEAIIEVDEAMKQKIIHKAWLKTSKALEKDTDKAESIAKDITLKDMKDKQEVDIKEKVSPNVDNTILRKDLREALDTIEDNQ
jgi:hypothetical protein